MLADLPVRYGLTAETLSLVLSWRAEGISWATIAERIGWHAPTLFQHYQWAAQAMLTSADTGCPDLDPEWPDETGKPRGPVLCASYPRCPCGEGTHRLSVPGDGRVKEMP